MLERGRCRRAPKKPMLQIPDSLIDRPTFPRLQTSKMPKVRFKTPFCCQLHVLVAKSNFYTSSYLAPMSCAPNDTFLLVGHYRLHVRSRACRPQDRSLVGRMCRSLLQIQGGGMRNRDCQSRWWSSPPRCRISRGGLPHGRMQKVFVRPRGNGNAQSHDQGFGTGPSLC